MQCLHLLEIQSTHCFFYSRQTFRSKRDEEWNKRCISIILIIQTFHMVALSSYSMQGSSSVAGTKKKNTEFSTDDAESPDYSDVPYYYVVNYFK